MSERGKCYNLCNLMPPDGKTGTPVGNLCIPEDTGHSTASLLHVRLIAGYHIEVTTALQQLRQDYSTDIHIS